MTLARQQHIKKSGIQRELNVKRPAIWTSPDCIVSIKPPPFAASAPGIWYFGLERRARRN